MQDGERGAGAPAVVRALRVLEWIAWSDGNIRMSELATELGIPKSSLHHVLVALTEAGWLERSTNTNELSLGLRAWEVGQAYGLAKTLAQRAQPYMDAVRDELGETVRLAVLSGTDNVLIAKSDGVHTLVFDQRVGARLPAHATGLGKALLSGLDPEAIERVYAGYGFEPFTVNTLTSVAAIVAETEAIRDRGWADDDGEYILGIRCIAYPVKARDGRLLAALSVSVPSTRFTDSHQQTTHQLLKKASTELGSRLGGETDLL